MTNHQNEKALQDMDSGLEALIHTTDSYVNGPLEKMIDRLSKLGSSSRTVSKTLEQFAEDILTVFTEDVVEAVFDTIGKDKKRQKSDDPIAFSGLLGGMFGAAGQNNSGSVTVNVINNTAAQARVNERTGVNGDREFEIMIDNMVANSLSGGRQTRTVLRSIFGIDNLLSSR